MGRRIHDPMDTVSNPALPKAPEKTLDEIALGFNPATDKCSVGHGYLDVYARYFEPMRHSRIKLLEIGVWEGASLRVWEAYFPLARIYGADKDITRSKYHDRSFLWEMSQSSEPSLINMAKEIGPWDIIIDDGSHLAQDQVLTFSTLWPYLNNGGVYCVEDLHINYQRGDGMVNFIGTTLQADLHMRGKLSTARPVNSNLAQQEKLSGRESEVYEIHLHRYVAVIIRSPQPTAK